MPACPRAAVIFVPIADVSGVASPIGMYQTVFPFKALTPDTGLTGAKLVAAALYFASSALMAEVLALEALAIALEALAVALALAVEPVLDALELEPLLEHAPTASTTAAAPVTPTSVPSRLR
jgi:hypothetical protein